LRLAKIWNCHPERVWNTRVDLVIDALQYEVFLQEMEETFYILNRKEE
jgi:hypothetical protein